MCRAVKCNQCGKTTWAGCGMHVDAVLRGVPEDARCACREAASSGAAPTGSLWGSIKSAFGSGRT